MSRSIAGILPLIVLLFSTSTSAGGGEAAAGIAKFSGEYLVGKTLDSIWDSATALPMVVSSDGIWLYSASEDATVKVWDVRPSTLEWNSNE